jgi:anti-sigma regulatory factor (Ser/Thr protein kinase)
VDGDGRLVGILTKGDVASGLLKALQSGRSQEDLRRYRASHLFEDIVSDRTSLILRYRVPPRDFSKGGMASAYVRLALLRLGASLETARRAAIAVYEAEMNLVIHTINGGILRVEVQPHAIFIEALDDGPGIADIELAMQPGYTTTPPEIKALGFGAGFGLNNIKRCVDKMWLQSKADEGTKLEMWIYLEPGAEQRMLETIFDRMIS